MSLVWIKACNANTWDVRLLNVARPGRACGPSSLAGLSLRRIPRPGRLAQPSRRHLQCTILRQVGKQETSMPDTRNRANCTCVPPSVAVQPRELLHDPMLDWPVGPSLVQDFKAWLRPRQGKGSAHVCHGRLTVTSRFLHDTSSRIRSKLPSIGCGIYRDQEKGPCSLLPGHLGRPSRPTITRLLVRRPYLFVHLRPPPMCTSPNFGLA